MDKLKFTINDLDREIPENKNRKVKFSLSDLEENKPLEQQHEPMFPDIAFNPFVKSPITKEEHKKLAGKHGDIATGLGQGLANVFIDPYNWIRKGLGKEPVNRANFSPDTFESKFAEHVAPFLGPQLLEVGPIAAGSSLSKIPAINKILQPIFQSFKSKPIVNSITKVTGKTAKGAADVGLISALENPEHPTDEFKKGAEFGGPLSLASHLVTSKIPGLSTLAKGGVGALIGGQYGHPFAGAATAIGLPIRKFAGLESNEDIAKEMLSGLESKDYSRAAAANERLGTVATPGEMTGNYVTSGKEGYLKKTAIGSRLGYRAEEKQKNAEKNAINKMLENIYKPTANNENKINKLYELSHNYSLKPEVVDRIRQNKLLDDSFRRVRTLPSMHGVPENNYKFLEQVENDLVRQKNSLSSTNKNESFYTGETHKEFNKLLKEQNPAYAEASKSSQPRIVRRNIEEKLNKEEEDLTAKNFYSRMLNSRKSYRELLRDTKNFPEAQQNIKDMRSAWKHLSNMKTSSQAHSHGQTGLDQARNFANYIEVQMHNIAGSNGIKNRMEFIYSKDWPKYASKIINAKDKESRLSAISNLVTKIGTAYGLNNDQINNLNYLISDK